jgi:hypothetical protein
MSFESALSFHGLIPEKVFTVKSATTKRKKTYQTPIGRFDYLTVPANYFSIGLQQTIMDDSYAFIIASPEKAICDLILTTSGLRFQSKKAVSKYLFDDLRIEPTHTTNLKPDIIDDCAKCGYKKSEMKLLRDVLIEFNKKG